MIHWQQVTLLSAGFSTAQSQMGQWDVAVKCAVTLQAQVITLQFVSCIKKAFCWSIWLCFYCVFCGMAIKYDHNKPRYVWSTCFSITSKTWIVIWNVFSHFRVEPAAAFFPPPQASRELVEVQNRTQNEHTVWSGKMRVKTNPERKDSSESRTVLLIIPNGSLSGGNETQKNTH